MQCVPSNTWPGANMLVVASRVPSPYRLNSLVKESPIPRRGEEEGDEKGGSEERRRGRRERCGSNDLVRGVEVCAQVRC